MKALADCRLYTFIDTAYLRGRAPEWVAQELCDGGSDIIQLRAKDASPEEIRRMTRSILPITRRAGVGLVVNDHFEIAAETGANACHLGQEDFFNAGHTHVSQLGNKHSQIQIGLSTHAPEQAERALAAEPHYIAIGPIYATPTKPNAKAVTLDYVHWAAANVEITWFAIGGITLKNLDSVLDAGAQRICVVSAILNAPDIAGMCQEFKRRIP